MQIEKRTKERKTKKKKRKKDLELQNLSPGMATTDLKTGLSLSRGCIYFLSFYVSGL